MQGNRLKNSSGKAVTQILLCKHTSLWILALWRPWLVTLLHVGGILVSNGFIEAFSWSFSIAIKKKKKPLFPKPYFPSPHPITYNFFAIIFSSFFLDLNILDWSLENLIAIAVGPAAHIWNGGTLQAIENIDLNSSSKYVSSLAWIKEGTCLAIGTSDGEVQVLDNLFF